jgi:hypothetical protein
MPLKLECISIFSSAPTKIVPCADRLTNCDEYTSDVCTNPFYRIWREDNCRKYCKICTGNYLCLSFCVTKQLNKPFSRVIRTTWREVLLHKQEVTCTYCLSHILTDRALRRATEKSATDDYRNVKFLSPLRFQYGESRC